MIVNAAGGRHGKGTSARAAARGHVHTLVKYLTQEKKHGVENQLRPILTNCTSNDPTDVTKEMEAWAQLNQNITEPVRHKVFSLEKEDRAPTVQEWQKMIQIYVEERGLGDARLAAFLHSDGHKNRNPLHLHLAYIRIKSNGTAVPDGWDSTVDRRVARRIESELGFKLNAGAGEKNKFNGRNRYTNRDRSGERQNLTPEQTHINPAIVDLAISRSHDLRSLRQNLQQAGIEMRTRRHCESNQIYAWSLRNLGGPREWTSGSKISPSHEFGWAKVQTQLDKNFASRQALSRSRYPARPRGGMHIEPPKPKQRLDQQVEEATGEAFSVMQSLLAAAVRHSAAPVKKAAPVRHPARPVRKFKPAGHHLQRPKP